MIKSIITIFFGLLITFIILVSLFGTAKAQEMHDLDDPNHWFPAFCCNQKDCRMLQPSEYEWRPEGLYIIASGDLIPHEDKSFKIPYSPDGNVYACFYEYTGKVLYHLNLWAPDGKGKNEKEWCVWRPMTGT